MLIYPTIELEAGRCVTQRPGRREETQIWHIDPVEAARRFAADGAAWLHLRDCDGAKGTGDNADLIRAIIRAAGVPVQVAGGIRSLDHVQRWADAGAGAMVIGTAALTDWEMVNQAAKRFPDMIAVSVDVAQGRLMAAGSETPTAIDPAAFVRSFEGVPLRAFVVTDIDYDNDLPDASFALTTGLAGETRTPVISSGLVKRLDDIATLRYVYNVAGAIVGRALFAKEFTLPEALAVARPAPERVAEFR